VPIPVPLSEILPSVLAPAESFYYQPLLLSFLYFTKIYFSLSGFLFSKAMGGFAGLKALSIEMDF
jgi:hypothetical protein